MSTLRLEWVVLNMAWAGDTTGGKTCSDQVSTEGLFSQWKSSQWNTLTRRKPYRQNHVLTGLSFLTVLPIVL